MSWQRTIFAVALVLAMQLGGAVCWCGGASVRTATMASTAVAWTGTASTVTASCPACCRHAGRAHRAPCRSPSTCPHCSGQTAELTTAPAGAQPPLMAVLPSFAVASVERVWIADARIAATNHSPAPPCPAPTLLSLRCALLV